jgi:CHAD domain-containing protein
MTNTGLRQSNTAALPPPAAPLAILSSSEPASAPSRPPDTSSLAQPAHAVGASNGHHTPLIRWRVPKETGACLANSLRDRWKTYCKQLRACRHDFSESSVHQLRVATRRLMTHFILLGGLLEDAAPGKARKKLKRRLKILGTLRDTQVQKLYLAEQSDRFPELASLCDFLHRRERKLAKAVRAQVLGLKTRKLEKSATTCCRKLASADRNPRHSTSLARQVFRSVTAAHSDLTRRRERIDAANSETLHSTRVAFKKFRYMIEALSPAFTGLGKAPLRRFAIFQRRMGNLQDLEVLQALVTEFVCKNPGATASLERFSRHVAAKRARALRSCLKHVDDLSAFSLSAVSDQPPALHRTAA